MADSALRILPPDLGVPEPGLVPRDFSSPTLVLQPWRESSQHQWYPLFTWRYIWSGRTSLQCSWKRLRRAPILLALAVALGIGLLPWLRDVPSLTLKRLGGNSLGTFAGARLVGLFRSLTLLGSALDSCRLGCLGWGSVPLPDLAC